MLPCRYPLRMNNVQARPSYRVLNPDDACGDGGGAASRRVVNRRRPAGAASCSQLEEVHPEEGTTMKMTTKVSKGKIPPPHIKTKFLMLGLDTQIEYVLQ